MRQYLIMASCAVFGDLPPASNRWCVALAHPGLFPGVEMAEFCAMARWRRSTAAMNSTPFLIRKDRNAS
jgi:hypothetical protein